RALHGVDEVGNEVVPPFQLHVDLLERVHRLGLEGDQTVVSGDHPQPHDDHQNQRNPQHRNSRVKEVRRCYYVGECGRSFASACRTTSATPASPGPTRASGWSASTCNSTPRVTGMRRHVVGAPASFVVSRVNQAVSARPERPRGMPSAPLSCKRSGNGSDAPSTCAQRRSNTSPVLSFMSLVSAVSVAPSIWRSLIQSSCRKWRYEYVAAVPRPSGGLTRPRVT